MKCIKMELGEPDASGRRKPVEIPGSEFVMELDAGRNDRSQHEVG